MSPRRTQLSQTGNAWSHRSLLVISKYVLSLSPLVRVWTYFRCLQGVHETGLRFRFLMAVPDPGASLEPRESIEVI
jgi:hypothetical protein